MKKLIISLLLLPVLLTGQITNRLIVTQNVPLNTSANNYMFTVPPNDNRIYVAKMDSLKLHHYNIIDFETFLYLKGDLRYKSITYSPSFTEIITGLNFTPLSVEVDGSITNELQSLSILGNTISLSNGGGSVVIPSNNYTAGTAISITSNVITNTAPDQTVTLTAGNRIAITGTYPNFTISYIEPTVNIITTKVLNSNYIINATKQALVSYSLTCTVTNPLLAGSSTADVYLEYSINAGSTWLLPSRNGNSSAVGLAVAVAITNGQTVTLTGVIPANALVRLRSVTTGTASVTYVTGTEIY